MIDCSLEVFRGEIGTEPVGNLAASTRTGSTRTLLNNRESGQDLIWAGGEHGGST
jgi:hypothetical protein